MFSYKYIQKHIWHFRKVDQGQRKITESCIFGG